MTNEEIQRRYDELERQLPTGQSMSLEDHKEVERLILDFARNLVSQAYEEAAEIVDKEFQALQREYFERRDRYDFDAPASADTILEAAKMERINDQGITAGGLARRIRALQDQLLEPVASV